MWLRLYVVVILIYVLHDVCGFVVHGWSFQPQIKIIVSTKMESR